jgi:hypothetical protein
MPYPLAAPAGLGTVLRRLPLAEIARYGIDRIVMPGTTAAD